MERRSCRLSISLLISSILVFSFLFSGFSPLDAASPKKKLGQIEKQLKSKKKKVKDVIRKEKTILSRIDNIEKDIKKKHKELKNYGRRISETQANITSISKEINSLNLKLRKSRGYLKKRLKALYKQQYGSNALILVSAKDYQDLIKKSKYISLAAHHDTKVMKNYSRKLSEINFRKNKMKVLYGKLETSKKNAEGKKRQLQTDRKKKSRLLATVRSKRSSYEKTISELEVSTKKLRQMIKRLEKKKVPKSIIGKGFRASKGHLQWPVTGKVLIPFGKYKDPKFNIPVFKNGIEIKAKKGEHPKAAYGGRIVFADWFKGYGLLLIINHGNGYHSLYGNLSEIFHKTGDIINKGTAIGTIGTPRLMDVSTLYFEIRYKGRPVDPQIWLKRKWKGKRKKRRLTKRK